MLDNKKLNVLNFFEKTLVDYYKVSMPRQEQVKMAMDILAYITKDTDSILFLEAPVGTGKSLGVLVPILQNLNNSVFSKESIIYATATINLQHQLMNTEAPLLQELNILNKDPLLAIGRAHYACYTAYLENIDHFSERTQYKLNRFFRFSKNNLDFELDQYDLKLTPEQWELISLGNWYKPCFHSKNCKAHQQRKNYFNSDIPLKITNHNQLIQAYLSYRRDNRPVLPLNPGYIIIDEGHLLQENFMSSIENTFNIPMLKSIKFRNKAGYIDVISELQVLIDQLKINAKENDQSGRVEISDSIYQKLDESREILKYAENIGNEKEYDNIYLYLELIRNKENYVSWYDLSDDKFHIIPNDYRDQIREFLLFLRKSNNVIIMSGTLTTNHEPDEIDYKWGMDMYTSLYFDYNQTFDYKNQGVVYVPKNLPEITRDGSEHIDAVEELIFKVQSLSNSGLLVLNSSKLYMNTIAEFLKDQMEHRNILVQGKGSVSELTKKFKEDKKSILVGSGSFNSGLSIPGQSLGIVVISKLPFPVPDDPIIKFQSQNMSNEETMDKVIIPEMISTLKQGMGRLIRSTKDYGIIVITDSRIWTKNYGEKIREIIENDGYNITDSLDDAMNFVKKLRLMVEYLWSMKRLIEGKTYI